MPLGDRGTQDIPKFLISDLCVYRGSCCDRFWGSDLRCRSGDCHGREGRVSENGSSALRPTPIRTHLVGFRLTGGATWSWAGLGFRCLCRTITARCIILADRSGMSRRWMFWMGVKQEVEEGKLKRGEKGGKSGGGQEIKAEAPLFDVASLEK